MSFNHPNDITISLSRKIMEFVHMMVDSPSQVSVMDNIYSESYQLLCYIEGMQIACKYFTWEEISFTIVLLYWRKVSLGLPREIDAKMLTFTQMKAELRMCRNINTFCWRVWLQHAAHTTPSQRYWFGFSGSCYLHLISLYNLWEISCQAPAFSASTPDIINVNDWLKGLLRREKTGQKC